MSPSLRGLVESRSRAQKWLLGIVLAGVAAALTGLTTDAVSSGFDRVRGLFEESKPPVGITVGQAIQANRRATLSSTHWIFTRPISSLEYPRSGDLGDAEVWEAWARRNGGIEWSVTGIEVVIEGTTPNPVILTKLTIEVVRRAPPPRGVRIIPFGGGPVGKRLFNVNLDDKPRQSLQRRMSFVRTLPSTFPTRFRRPTQRYSASSPAQRNATVRGRRDSTGSIREKTGSL